MEISSISPVTTQESENYTLNRKEELSMAEELPHIILINTDQQRADTISALGEDYMETPNLDEMVEKGVTFTNNFAPAPSCVPARASLFTGYYPHNTSVYTNADEWSPNWVETLANEGYQCVNIGKMHTIPLDAPGGFHERYPVENKDRGRLLDDPDKAYLDEWDRFLLNNDQEKPCREKYSELDGFEDALGAFEWPLEERYHSDFFVGDLTRRWLENREATCPLFLEIGFPGPHPPYDPIKRYINRYIDKELPLPHVTDEEIANQPPPQHKLREEMIKYEGTRARGPHDAVQWKENPTEKELHRMRAHYYANVTMIDEKIGEIIDVLDKNGYLDNAIIIFTSDHGDALGDHGHIEKWTMYECSVHVPLIIWAPGRFEGGKKIDALVQHVDLASTILELANINPPESWNSRSILPLLRGETSEIREYVFAEQGSEEKDPWPVWIPGDTHLMTMIRSKEWKLVHYLGQTYGELYNLKHDPEEKVNLWESDKHREIKDNLLTVLREWRMSTEYQSSPSALR